MCHCHVIQLIRTLLDIVTAAVSCSCCDSELDGWRATVIQCIRRLSFSKVYRILLICYCSSCWMLRQWLLLLTHTDTNPRTAATSSTTCFSTSHATILLIINKPTLDGWTVLFASNDLTRSAGLITHRLLLRIPHALVSLTRQRLLQSTVNRKRVRTVGCPCPSQTAAPRHHQRTDCLFHDHQPIRSVHYQPSQHLSSLPSHSSLPLSMSSSKVKSPKASSSPRGSKDDGEEGKSEGFKPPYKTDARADEMMKQADKKLSKSSIMAVFSSSNKYEDAIELILKAAAQYKVSKNWSASNEHTHRRSPTHSLLLSSCTR